MRGAILLAVTVVLASLFVVVSPAVAASAAASAAGTEITLITGDRVTYFQGSGGQRSYTVDPAPRPAGRAVAFHHMSRGEDFHVVPSDVLPLVSAGKVDRSLFNLPGLIRQGYDDAHAADLPVIVTFRGKRDIGAMAEELPGARRTAKLETIRGAALEVDRSGIVRFWRSLDGLDKDMAEVWLDQKVTSSLDTSVPQIGAPRAWQEGYDGKGVTVAVIDSGVDATHPDLKGKVSEARNFTDEPDADDGTGHGTHVASTIAGSGAASDGQYKGVAPEASLLNGRVFDDAGESRSSWIIKAMEWAAHHDDVKAINMSLGSRAASDGTDLMSRTVNRLTRETGALFVIAAGNWGDEAVTVSSPGAADAALTVGAVDDQDELADFSSRGPRLEDGAVKPEITAPGVDIVAARAEGTNPGPPVGEHYTTLRGTSMATPHVAGAAAILAQADPGMDAAELKDALVSTAKDGGYRWFEQGTGRVDVPAALHRKVTGPASVNVGRMPRDADSETRRLTYRNATDEPVTLKLALSLTGFDKTPVPDDAARLSAGTLVVPARGEAGVDLTVDPGAAKKGAYGGEVTAMSDDGGVTLRSAVGYQVGPPTAKVTLRVTDANGEPMSLGGASLYNLAPNTNDPLGDRVEYFADVIDGVATFRVPEGEYDAVVFAFDSEVTAMRQDLTTAIEVKARGETEVPLDARDNVPVRAISPRPADTYGHELRLQRVIEPGLVTGITITDLVPGNMFISPTPRAKHTKLSLFDLWITGDRLLDVRVRGRRPMTLHPRYDPYIVAGAWPGRRTLPLLWAREGTDDDFRDIDVRGKLALVRVSGDLGAEPREWAITAATKNAAEAGAAGVVVYADRRGAHALPPFGTPARPQLFVTNDEGERLRALTGRGPVSVALRGRSAVSAMYHQAFYDEGAVPDDLERQINPARMKRVAARYHAEKPDLDLVRDVRAHGPDGTAVAATHEERAPAARTEYYGASDRRINWLRAISLDGAKADSAPFAALSMPGARGYAREGWFEAQITYGAADPRELGNWLIPCSFCRADNDEFAPGLHQVDGAGHFTQPSLSKRAMERSRTTIRLFRGDEEIEPSYVSRRPFPTFRMAPDPATYRLETDVPPPTKPPAAELPGAVFRTAPHVRTTWTFRSARPAASLPSGYVCSPDVDAKRCAFQPLIELRYRLGLDSHNAAPAGRPHAFTIEAGRHSGVPGRARIARLRVEYSADKGESWRRALVLPMGDGRFRAVVRNPRSDGFVWLRASAWDTAGNRVNQTIERAYAVSSRR